jgi:OOP family OmpA-OmpF porin
MKRHMSSNRWSLACGIPLVLASVSACGGTITFADTTPIRIAVAPPPPEPEPLPPPKKEVKIRDNRMEISEKIQFAYNDSRILEVSFEMMDELAKVMQENPHVQKVRIEGHASSEGSDELNMALSNARAHAVRAYLIAKGVSADRLAAVGYGETKPIATNDTEAGRETNRRVEFQITKQAVTKEKVEIDPSTGEEKVIETTSMNEDGEG